MLTTLTQQ